MLEMTGTHSGTVSAEPTRAPRVRRGFGLASRVLLLTIAFVMVAEIAIYIPSIASFRNGWLRDRLAAARTAALVFQAAPNGMIPDSLKMEILGSVGARIIVIKVKEKRTLLAVSDMPEKVDETFDLRDPGAWTSVTAAFRALFAPPGRMLTVLGNSPMGHGKLEITLDETPLGVAMRAYSFNVLWVSLIISAIVAALAVAAMHWFVLRPVQRLTSSIIAFGQNPEDATRIASPSDRLDEIGRAQTALSTMQTTLIQDLSQKRHLAALGLAVAKINHDLRNLLASAQLFSDRLSGLADPLAQRLGPKLIGTLDRAIAFCQATLTYGHAVEPAPRRGTFVLHTVVEDAAETAAPAGISRVTVHNDVPKGMEIVGDPEQIFRVLSNLCRNAVDALDSADSASAQPPRITISARERAGNVAIDVSDNGPGVAPRARARLFEAFQGSTRSGGTGLGLAIAADLVRAHGGSIELIESTVGATFRIVLPQSGKNERPTERANSQG